MWPLFVLLSKFLGTEEDNTEESERDHLSLVLKQSLGRDGFHGTVSGSYFVDVPHINQLHSWDCGLACVLMVLRFLGIKDGNMQELEEFCCTTSIWTVDLAYLLKKFSVSFSYFTVTLGANPSFSVETFYKEQLPNDLVRVDMLFQKARDAGISIEEKELWRTPLGNEVFKRSRLKKRLNEFDLDEWVEESIEQIYLTYLIYNFNINSAYIYMLMLNFIFNMPSMSSTCLTWAIRSNSHLKSPLKKMIGKHTRE
ncbi:uncharacterized protein LOC107014811 isoform X2 [Solanum pennellii]|uniref:Uncharacterized protein LOC107014811 isoform X2 n=1 Tax=Solanum pennellii TaxID=28526 RepID=A0ABM1GFH8_SOLPN|nr:uncharacterized protein LOC107014811 isoform X2 [Solanum pennellii]XP_027771258.1 uncharacterized protein LOC107014811 isoform X2 [Solanum pennellii]